MRTRAKRLDHIGTAVFFEMETQKSALQAQGRTVTDLGIGSPDQPPAAFIRQALQDALEDPAAFGYPRSQGTLGFRQAAVNFLDRRYQVTLDPETEVLTLMGAQDGLSHLTLALIDPGDIVLVPDPGYPIYEASVHLAGGTPYPLPLRAENGFLPDLQAVPEDILKRAKLLLLNYPNNPTTALAPDSFFDEVIAFAKTYDLWVMHDAAYSELSFGAEPCPSFLSKAGAKDVGIEIHSLSKTFHYAGARLAFAAGNADILKALAVVKSNIDYGVFTPVQVAGAVALQDDRGHIAATRELYQARRDAFLGPLQSAGWAIPTPQATMFVWAPIPSKQDSRAFARHLLTAASVACVPGVGFGAQGEGFVRFSLVQDASVLREAALRIVQVLG
ncbi:MAG: aminotransferase class I/II-fold pyridoxal phosphate-dependent enzyme [Firmicutes bacterium]|nr:aminotransferase class I/II-fold pyridoxal phosphate-dependent enzyme [Bacillota bacterium]